MEQRSQVSLLPFPAAPVPGTYLDEHFREEAWHWSIAAYKSLLALISWDIRSRSKAWHCPTPTRTPAVVEEHGTVSVAPCAGHSPSLRSPPPTSRQ